VKLTITGEGVTIPAELELPEPVAPPPDPTPRDALTTARAKLHNKHLGTAQTTNSIDLTAPEVGILLHALNLYDERLKVIEILQGKR
jgi:hypothetical protein